jgi:hypothetical protein
MDVFEHVVCPKKTLGGGHNLLMMETMNKFDTQEENESTTDTYLEMLIDVFRNRSANPKIWRTRIPFV